MALTLQRDGDASEADGRSVRAGADGVVRLKLGQEGRYLLWTRMQADAPAGADTDIRSYTTSLVFDAAP